MLVSGSSGSALLRCFYVIGSAATGMSVPGRALQDARRCRANLNKTITRAAASAAAAAYGRGGGTAADDAVY